MRGRTKPKHPTKKVTESDTATDKEGTQSETDETPENEDAKHSSRQVRSRRTRVRRTRTKQGENDNDLTRSESASSSAALGGSEPCLNYSSEDLNWTSEEEEEIAERSKELIKKYQDVMDSHKKTRIKIRRIKQSSGNSATLYGNTTSNTKDTRARFIADSGSGIPIISLNLVERYELS